MVRLWPECVVKLISASLHTVPRIAPSKDIRARVTARPERVSAASAGFLVNHELLEGVQVRWDEGADGLVVVVEDLLSSTLWAHRAGWPDQAGVRGAITLVEHKQTSLFTHYSEKHHLWDFMFSCNIFCYSADLFTSCNKITITHLALNVLIINDVFNCPLMQVRAKWNVFVLKQ